MVMFIKQTKTTKLDSARTDVWVSTLTEDYARDALNSIANELESYSLGLCKKDKKS